MTERRYLTTYDDKHRSIPKLGVIKEDTKRTHNVFVLTGKARLGELKDGGYFVDKNDKLCQVHPFARHTEKRITCWDFFNDDQVLYFSPKTLVSRVEFVKIFDIEQRDGKWIKNLLIPAFVNQDLFDPEHIWINVVEEEKVIIITSNNAIPDSVKQDFNRYFEHRSSFGICGFDGYTCRFVALEKEAEQS